MHPNALTSTRSHLQRFSFQIRLYLQTAKVRTLMYLLEDMILPIREGKSKSEIIDSVSSPTAV